uniref:Uncharacterized protein n=1 Tax=Sarcoptes scabiei TaxID=52283 RepID=A0A834REK7_SARSC
MLPSARSLKLFQESTTDNGDKKSSSEELSVTNKSTNKVTRIFPSVRNQFVVQIEYSLKNNPIVEDVIENFSNFFDETIQFQIDPHLSFVYGHYAVQYHQIESLLKELSDSIQCFRKFSICLNSIKILPNSNRSKFFIAICEARDDYIENNDDHNPSSIVESKNFSHKRSKRILIECIHEILQQFRSTVIGVNSINLKNFIYHSSLAWFLPENYQDGEKLSRLLGDYFQKNMIFIRIDHLQVKIGHKSSIINLN